MTKKIRKANRKATKRKVKKYDVVISVTAKNVSKAQADKMKLYTPIKHA